MCTVTFLPLADGYLLATNRDERRDRGAALPPSLRRLGGRRVVAPTDADAGGTWVAVDDLGRGLCILNGDRPPARPPPADAPSRGRLGLDLMEEPVRDAALERLERRRADGRLRERPFKLLVLEPGPTPLMHRIDWDGVQLATAETSEPSLAISSTFEPDAVARVRAEAFVELLERVAAPADELAAAQRRWHASHTPSRPEGDAYGVCMHRPDARTVSLTAVAVTAGEVSMAYQPGHPCEGSPTVTVRIPRRAARGSARAGVPHRRRR